MHTVTKHCLDVGEGKTAVMNVCTAGSTTQQWIFARHYVPKRRFKEPQT